MWVFAYWWQGLVLISLYIFVFLIYREVQTEKFREPIALLIIVKAPASTVIAQYVEGVIPLYDDLPLEVQGEKIYFKNNDIYLHKADLDPQKIASGKVFDYAGGSLQLVRWNDARQLLN